MSAVLVDTNVLVYAYLPLDQDKRAQRAKEIVEMLVREGRGRLSSQVLAEFGAVQMRRRSPPPDPAEIVQAVRDLAGAFRVHSYSGSTVAAAVEACSRHQIQFWDALIWAVARENGIGLVYTEGCADGRVIEGVEYVNPFEIERR